MVWLGAVLAVAVAVVDVEVAVAAMVIFTLWKLLSQSSQLKQADLAVVVVVAVAAE